MKTYAKLMSNLRLVKNLETLYVSEQHCAESREQLIQQGKYYTSKIETMYICVKLKFMQVKSLWELILTHGSESNVMFVISLTVAGKKLL